MKALESILARTSLRILIYILLLVLFYLGANLAIDKLFPSSNSLWMINLINITNLTPMLAASILIENFRASGKAFNFGLTVDRFSLKHILIGILLPVAGYTFFTFFALFAGAVLKYNWNMFPNPSDYLFYILFTCFCVAFNEELFFRGIIFQSLIEKYNKYLITFLISFGFACAHLGNPNYGVLAFINVFLAGILFSAAYIKTKSLWLPISFHFTWNFIQGAIIGLPISGVPGSFSVFSLQYGNNTFINEYLLGGKFGAEGGFITTLCLIVSLYVILKFAKESPFASAAQFKRQYAESELLSAKLFNR